jgi:eukaryotic-like serine/threonine-protein kinase
VSVQDALLQKYITRRSVMKGLAAFAFAASAIGCASPNLSSGLTPTPAAIPLPPGSVIYTYTGHSDQVLAVSWSRDGRHVASASWDKTVKVWDTTTGNHVYTYHGHSDLVTSVTWSPDGTSIASGSSDKSVRVWNASTGALLYAYRGHTGGVTAVEWSPDGKRIASGSTDKSVQIYDAPTGSHLSTYHGHTGEITAVAWFPDSTYIASGSADQSVQTWNISTGALLYVYRGYNVDQASKNPTKGVLPDLIYTVAWSHNGKRIAAVTQEYCGDDCGVVLTWDALNEGHFSFYPTFPMYTLAWSPDDRHLVTAVAQGSVNAGGMPVVQIRQA